MKIKYVGDNESVWVPALDQTVERDVPVEAPTAIAESLLEQPVNWAKTDNKKKGDI